MIRYGSIIISKKELDRGRLDVELCKLSKKTGFSYRSNLSKNIEKEFKKSFLSYKKYIKKQLWGNNDF